MSSVESQKLIEKRENQLQVVMNISQQLNQKQEEVNNLRNSLTLNQGALYQLNTLLEELGVNLESLDKSADETVEGVVEPPAEA